MVMRRQIQMPHHILALHLDIHGPGIEIDLAGDLAGDDPLLGRTARFIPRAFFKVRLVFEHYLLARDSDLFAALGGVPGKAGVGIGDGHSGRGGRGLGRSEGHVRKSGDGLSIRGFAGDFPAVGEDIVSHQVLRFPGRLITMAARWPSSLAQWQSMAGPGA